jgi:hypothetical protein
LRLSGKLAIDLNNRALFMAIDLRSMARDVQR